MDKDDIRNDQFLRGFRDEKLFLPGILRVQLGDFLVDFQFFREFLRQIIITVERRVNLGKGWQIDHRHHFQLRKF